MENNKKVSSILKKKVSSIPSLSGLLGSLILVLALAGSLCVSASQAATFQWIPNTEPDLASYHLFACTAAPCNTGTEVATIPNTRTDVTIPNPTETTYYSLSAKDLTGNTSLRSNTVVFTVVPPVDTTPPTAPLNLQLSNARVLTDANNAAWSLETATCRVLRTGVPVLQTSSLMMVDNFDRANALDLGSSWYAGYTDQGGANANLQIVGNRVQATAALDATETYAWAALSNNQWAQVTLATYGGGTAVPRLLLRVGAPGAKSGYEFAIGLGGISFTSRIGRWNAGVFTQLAAENSTAWVASDVLRAEADGTTLRLYRNNGLVLVTTDAAVTSGRAGITIYAATIADVELDDFSAGDLPWSLVHAVSPVYATDMRINANGNVEILGAGPSCVPVLPEAWLSYNGAMFVSVP